MTYCSITFCNCSLFGFDFFFSGLRQQILRFLYAYGILALISMVAVSYGLWSLVSLCVQEQVLFTFPSLEHQWHSRIPESLIVWFVSGLRLLSRILVCLKSPLYMHNSFQTVRRADVSSTNPNMVRGLLSVSSGTLLANFIIFVF